MSKRAKVIDIGERTELFRLMDLDDAGYFDQIEAEAFTLCEPSSF